MKRKINLFIVGAQKAGTTSLDKYLGEHPSIYLPEGKEIDFFFNDDFYKKGEKYLDPYYKDQSIEDIIGMSGCGMLYFDYVPKRICNYNPDAKIIIIFRNPIDRAYSAFWFAKRVGREPLDSFEDALERERTGGVHGLYPRGDLTYLEHGHYAEQLYRYNTFFSKEQIYILLTEDMKNNEFIRPILQWLNVNPDSVSIDTSQKYNESAMPKIIWLHRIIMSPDSIFKKNYRAIMPFQLRKIIQRYITNRLLEKTLVPFKYPPMNEETRQMLREYFRPHNHRLSTIIGRNLEHWK